MANMKDYHNIIINTSKCDCDDYGNRKKVKNKNSEDYWNKTSESMKAYSTKHSNDRLKPLERFLDKNVGKKWDDIYSKLSKIADKRSIRGFHLHQHIREYVSITERELEAPYRLKSRYYVDNNGFLRKRSKKERGYKAETKKERSESDAIYRERKNENKIDLNEDTYLKKLNGIWFHFTKVEAPKNINLVKKCELILQYNSYYRSNKPVEKMSFDELFYYKKKQLNKKELKKYNLKNDI